jgi:hypothetical protein
MATILIHRDLEWATYVLAGMLTAASVSAVPAQPVTKDADKLEEVQVVASKLDKHTLNRVAMKFVESHAVANPVIHQIGRWRAEVCPGVTGLAPAATAFVSGRVEEVARSVGAPTHKGGGKCTVNVEVVFTPEPQQLLNHIATAYPGLLGSSRSAGDTTFSHAIQSWYLTGTRSVEGFQPLTDSAAEAAFIGGPDPYEMEVSLAISRSGSTTDGVSINPPSGSGFSPWGRTGSYVSKGLTGELMHVFIVVDAGKIAATSLRSTADYIAMLALTRMGSLDTCSELPSIIDLLSSGCGERQKPPALTDADVTYLKALYSSDLEKNLNVEQGDMRDRMVRVMLGK